MQGHLVGLKLLDLSFQRIDFFLVALLRFVLALHRRLPLILYLCLSFLPLVGDMRLSVLILHGFLVNDFDLNRSCIVSL